MDNKEVINIIPSKDISFRTRSLLSQILSRLELSNQDRLDLEKYITFGGGENLDYVKDNLEIFIKYKDKILNIIKDTPEEFDTLIEIFNYIEQHIQDAPFEKGSAENSAVLKGEYEGYSNKAISQISMAVGAATMSGLKGWYYSTIDFTNNIITLSDKQPYALLGALVGGAWSSGTPNISVGDKVSIVNNSKYDYCGEVKSISSNKITLKSALPFNTLDIGAIAVNNPDDWSIYLPDKPDVGIIDFGGGAFSEGGQSKASNICAHAEGLQTHAYGQYAHTEGRDTKAGYAAHAEGRGNKAIGEESHAEGLNTTANGKHSHTEGDITSASGVNAHAEGYLSQAIGNSSHSEGGNWVKGATGAARINGGTAEGAGSHAEGAKTTAIGDYSHAEGYRSTASGPNSHSEGQLTRTGGEDVDRPTGNPGTKSGQNAHAEGAVTFAQGAGSHAEGGNTWASGNYSHTEGWQTRTHPTANNSHAEGFYTETTNRAEHAEGEYNKSNSGTIHSVGIGTGTDYNKRKNAHEIMRDGKHYIYGIGGYDGTNPDGSEDVATVITRVSATPGIDPVVWKYMCNPIFIEAYVNIPADLLEKISSLDDTNYVDYLFLCNIMFVADNMLRPTRIKTFEYLEDVIVDSEGTFRRCLKIYTETTDVANIGINLDTGMVDYIN